MISGTLRLANSKVWGRGTALAPKARPERGSALLPARKRTILGAASPRVNELNQQLASREALDRQSLLAALRDARWLQGMPELALSKGLANIEHHIRGTPLHVGFMPRQALFDVEGVFLAGGYKNRQRLAWEKSHHQNNGWEMAALDKPVYAALNVSLRGHKGWGSSSLVLKPHLQKFAELHSRDTGDPEGIGAFAETATYLHPLSLIKDWVRRGCLEDYWQALAGGERKAIDWGKVNPYFPVEAALYMPAGLIEPDDVALILIDLDEWEAQSQLGALGAESLPERLAAVEAFAGRGKGDAQVLYRRGHDPLTEFPEYREILHAYEKERS